MTTDAETGLETCKFCQKTFNRQSNLMDHIDNVHLKVQSYECQLCGMKYSGKSQLSVHIKRKHTPEEKNFGQKPIYDKDALFSCHICQISFLQKKYYRRHIIRTNQDGKKLFKCCACDKKFTFPDGIRSHMKHIELVHDVHIKRQQNSETHICDQCGFPAKSIRSLSLHNRQKHNSENIPKRNKKKCPHCDYEGRQDYLNYTLTKNILNMERKISFVINVINLLFSSLHLSTMRRIVAKTQEIVKL